MCTCTLSSFTCTLEQNTDNSVLLEAGTDKVQVHIGQIGYADNTAASAENIALTLSMSPASSTSGALITGTLTGTGFPRSKEQAGDLAISICGNEVTDIISITNIEIRFVIPPEVTACTGSNSQVSFNSKTASITFAYDNSLAPTISSLSKTSASPIMKGSMTITGTNFGDSSNTKVYLYQDGVEKYELTATSVTSTSISCILGGGKSGDYVVIVKNLNVGSSVPDANSQFSYKIYVDSISPVSGHQGGGYNITITGRNFAPASGSSNVFVGTAMNSYCEITAITETSITCTVPRMKDEYNVEDQLDVVVTGRIIEESECAGTCNFKFVSAGTPTVTTTEFLDVTAGTSLTIQGTGLTGSSVTIGGQECVVEANSDTEINCTYPALQSGWYEV